MPNNPSSDTPNANDYQPSRLYAIAFWRAVKAIFTNGFPEPPTQAEITEKVRFSSKDLNEIVGGFATSIATWIDSCDDKAVSLSLYDATLEFLAKHRNECLKALEKQNDD